MMIEDLLRLKGIYRLFFFFFVFSFPYWKSFTHLSTVLGPKEWKEKPILHYNMFQQGQENPIYVPIIISSSEHLSL